MENMASKRERRLTLGFLAAVFVFMFVFFYNIHPLVILDADDWTYVSYSRMALPSARYWNPSRILPELLMSGCSNFAVFALLPLMHDYIRALSLVYALVLSLFITGYTWCLLRLLERRIGLERVWSLPAAALFLIFHFLIFRTKSSGNSYMLRSCNVTCYFYYTIPALLNCSLLMYFLSGSGPDAYMREGGVLKKGVLLLLCYLAVFSNLFASVILATYAGCVLLFALVECIREKRGVLSLIRERAVSLGIFLMWCVSAVFELLGGRAASFDGEKSLGALLAVSAGRAVDVIKSMSPIFLLLAAGLAAMALIAYLSAKKTGAASGEAKGLFLTLILSGAIVSALIIILAAKTDPKYIDPYRADLIFGMTFFPVLLITLCGAYVLRRFGWVRVLVPLMIVVLLSAVNTSSATFAESNMILTSHEKVADMSRDVLEQVIAADRAGLLTAEIYVSDVGTSDNWPQATYMGKRLADSLYKHGLISREIELIIVPSQEYNEKFGLDFG